MSVVVIVVVEQMLLLWAGVEGYWVLIAEWRPAAWVQRLVVVVEGHLVGQLLKSG